MGVFLPNDPGLMSLDAFLDFVWISLDPSADNGIGTVGGTAQLYLGT